MTFTVFDENRAVGDLTIEPRGLYYEITAKVECYAGIRRIYGVREGKAFCLGVPDQNGEFHRRISQKTFVMPERVIVSTTDLCSPTLQEKDIHNREMVEEYSEIFMDTEMSEQPSLIERENGGEENEAHLQNNSTDIDPLLFADLPADYDYGGTGTEEADCHYIR